MSTVLTPEQVATFRDWADLDPIVPNQELRSAIHALGIDWLALQVQLADVQEDAQVMSGILKHLLDSGTYKGSEVKEALARPGVVKLVKGGTP